MTYGAARGMKDFIVITLGTGVGSGIVIGGNLVYGHDGFAGELGHVIMRRNNGRPCGCGRQGCLEAYASATGVAVQHANSWKSARMTVCFANWIRTKSHQKTCMMQQ